MGGRSFFKSLGAKVSEVQSLIASNEIEPGDSTFEYNYLPTLAYHRDYKTGDDPGGDDVTGASAQAAIPLRKVPVIV